MAKADLVGGIRTILQRLDKLIDLSKHDGIEFEDGMSTLLEDSKNTVCLSEAGLIDLVKAIKDK